ncbi:MAG TPA: polysulfide reductase NrfD [Candidatus Methanoperedenaceae archaeon]|nr:polysulfide reductase NrfD [Candidatus Methanoperedenaceae archaeon]
MKLDKPVFWLALITLLIGAYGMLTRVFVGRSEVNYGSYIPWGLEVAGYTFLSGISAGAFLMAALAYVFDIKRLEKLRLIGIIAALSTSIAALIIIISDLGHPLRALTSLVNINLSSAMAWTFIIFPLYMLVIIAMSWMIPKGDGRKVKALAAIGILLALVLEFADGAIYSVVGAKPYWNAGILTIMFLTSSLLTGIAFVAFIAYVLYSDSEEHMENMRNLRLPLLYLVLFYALLEFSDIVSLYYAKIPSDIASINLVLFGPYGWVFWTFFVFGSVLIPAVLLAFDGKKSLPLALASFFLLISFPSTKMNILLPGLAVPELKGLETAFVHERLMFSYFPSTMEWLIFLFCFSLSVVLVIAGTRRIVDKKPVMSLIKEVA